MGKDVTTIRVHRDTWQRLHDRKAPGDSMDTILTELLDAVDEDPIAESADD